MRASAYIRISDEREDIANQRTRFKEWVQDNASDYILGKIYQEIKSGGLDENRRPIFAQMIADAEAGKFGLLWVWEQSRITRQGGVKLSLFLQNMSRHNVLVYSHTEGFLEADSAQGEVKTVLQAYGSRAYREFISKATKNKLDLIRKEIAEKGYHITPEGRKITSLGRSKLILGKGSARHLLTQDELDLIWELRQKAWSYGDIAERLHASPEFVRRLVVKGIQKVND